VGIALFTVVLLHLYVGRLYGALAERGIKLTQSQITRAREFVLRAEQTGLHNVTPPPFMRDIIRQFEAAHVYAFQLTFVLMGLVALVGAIMSWLLVRQTDREGFPRTSSPGARGGPGPPQEKDQG
jgi:hypothetical protein